MAFRLPALFMLCALALLMVPSASACHPAPSPTAVAECGDTSWVPFGVVPHALDCATAAEDDAGALCAYTVELVSEVLFGCPPTITCTL